MLYKPCKFHLNPLGVSKRLEKNHFLKTRANVVSNQWVGLPLM